MPTSTLKSGKRGGKTKTSWKPGQSGNPAGRPKDSESWAGIIKSVGDMYSSDLLAFIGVNNELGREIAKYPKDTQLKYLVTARVFSALMFEPSSGLWKELMERADGKVVEKHDITGNVKIGKDDSDTRGEILRKLDSIATAATAAVVDKQPE